MEETKEYLTGFISIWDKSNGGKWVGIPKFDGVLMSVEDVNKAFSLSSVSLEEEAIRVYSKEKGIDDVKFLISKAKLGTREEDSKSILQEVHVYVSDKEGNKENIDFLLELIKVSN